MVVVVVGMVEEMEEKKVEELVEKEVELEVGMVEHGRPKEGKGLLVSFSVGRKKEEKNNNEGERKEEVFI